MVTIIPQPDDDSLLHLPIEERILDRLIDLLLDVDEVLALIARNPSAPLSEAEPFLRRAFEEMDQAIRRISD